ncbi:Myeloid leukemia factor 2 [Acipenser ruthenus]|uniref:Myeloid leukemia factor 2 n=1 Tax=Acipenser ruthenus TaxID=7906 RepID=A0A662YPS1_ACIRT|nr:Myeloid leukemia factor 2 [Acipenser ruthenus]
MFRYLRDMDENPYMLDPFATHRQQMRSMFGAFGFDPFLGITDGRTVSAPIQPARRPQIQAGALSPFGMMGMGGGGGFMDMFGMMSSMMENMAKELLGTKAVMKSTTADKKVVVSSYIVAQKIAIAKSSHTIAEELVKLCVIEIVKEMFGKQKAKELAKIPM